MPGIVIFAYGLSSKRKDKKIYYDGLKELIKKKEGELYIRTILHTDRGYVFSSKEYNDVLELFNIHRSMSRGGKPTDNGTIESLNGWIKEELFNDFRINNSVNIEKSIKEYINYFNTCRPSFALNYLTPKQYKEKIYYV